MVAIGIQPAIPNVPAPKPESDIATLSARQVALLIALRDALVRTSLSLNDLKFELDQNARESAQRDCQTVLQRISQQSRTNH